MVNSSDRRAQRRLLGGPFLVAALVVGAAMGCRGGEPQYKHLAVGAVIIRVGPQAKNVVPETQSLSYEERDVAVWIAVDESGKIDKTKNLSIEFDDDVFEGAEPQANKRFRVQCVGWMCYSGNISGKVDARIPHKYSQILTDANNPSARDEADGHIIIVKP
jgi:hypothetical protein